jgi:hypothetical protein
VAGEGRDENELDGCGQRRRARRLAGGRRLHGKEGDATRSTTWKQRRLPASFVLFFAKNHWPSLDSRTSFWWA